MHPVFDRAARAAQSAIASLQGARRTWFCGAHMRHGFHEDGLSSAVHVAERLGATLPWRVGGPLPEAPVARGRHGQPVPEALRPVALLPGTEVA